MKQGINKRTHTRFKINLPESSERDLLCSSFFTGKFSLPLKSFTPGSSSLSVPEKCPSLLTHPPVFLSRPLLFFSLFFFFFLSFFSSVCVFLSKPPSSPLLLSSARMKSLTTGTAGVSAPLHLYVSCRRHPNSVGGPLPLQQDK